MCRAVNRKRQNNYGICHQFLFLNVLENWRTSFSLFGVYIKCPGLLRKTSVFMHLHYSRFWRIRRRIGPQGSRVLCRIGWVVWSHFDPWFETQGDMTPWRKNLDENRIFLSLPLGGRNHLIIITMKKFENCTVPSVTDMYYDSDSRSFCY